ncbi:MAG: hypothetical protein IPL61_20765 [Myxococcales bacterium]|nr:hypothetical protein [Myxococcales bacterium]
MRRSRLALAWITRLGLAALPAGLALSTAPGCGVKDPQTVKLTIAAASITIVQADGARHEFALDAGGMVTVDGKPFGKLSRDGRLQAGTATTVRLTKDGSVLVHGNVSNVRVSPEAAFMLDGATALTIDSAGQITGPLLADIDHPMFKAEGATLTYAGPPETRRALMFAFAAALTSAPAQPVPANP